jgi:IS30 family transposase
VQKKLLLRWSPEQISHVLVKKFPDDPEMRVSLESIYQALYLKHAVVCAVKCNSRCEPGAPAANHAKPLTPFVPGSSTRWS